MSISATDIEPLGQTLGCVAPSYSELAVDTINQLVLHPSVGEEPMGTIS
jgi:hypothetical protein